MLHACRPTFNVYDDFNLQRAISTLTTVLSMFLINRFVYESLRCIKFDHNK